MRITLSDIARRLGMSKSTVSIGLRNDQRLPAATRDKIRRMALELGYRPDPSLAAIAAQRWRHRGRHHGVGVALLDNRNEPADHTRKALLGFAGARLEQLGYRVTRFDLDAQPTVAATQRILIARGIRGVLVPPIYRHELLAELDLPSFSLAAAGLARWQPPFAAATQDVFEDVTEALRRIVDHGYRRIGVALLRHEGNVPDDAHRLGATLHAQARYRETGVTITVWEGRIGSLGDEMRPFLAWFRAERPQALLAFNAFARDWLLHAGLTLPGLATLNRFAKAVELAGIEPQHRRIAEAAAELLDQEIRHHRTGVSADAPTRLLIPPRWTDGPSLPPFKAGPARSHR
jgi:DNA-binding LacI/PurR family transcriptional regulator